MGVNKQEGREGTAWWVCWAKGKIRSNSLYYSSNKIRNILEFKPCLEEQYEIKVKLGIQQLTQRTRLLFVGGIC